VSFAWLCLLLALSPSFAGAPPELEAPDHRSYAEATPEMLARRAQTCRADLKDYKVQPTLELMDRLVVCMEHPEGQLRDEVLDDLPDRRLWDRPDFDAKVKPVMQELYNRFQHDPNARVRLHAGQLGMWLHNAQRWHDWDSPEAQARREAQARHSGRHPPIDGASSKLGDYALVITAVVVLLVGCIGKLLRIG
jgi:hypothetical protein